MSHRDPQTAPSIDDRILRERELAYVMSDVDAVLALKAPRLDDVSALLELRCEAALAALAGVVLIAVCDEAPQPPSTRLSDAIESDSAAELRNALAARVLDMPHLAIHYPTGVQPDAAGYRELEELMRSATQGISQGSLEQWLATQTSRALGRRLAGILTAE